MRWKNGSCQAILPIAGNTWLSFDSFSFLNAYLVLWVWSDIVQSLIVSSFTNDSWLIGKVFWLRDIRPASPSGHVDCGPCGSQTAWFKPSAVKFPLICQELRIADRGRLFKADARIASLAVCWWDPIWMIFDCKLSLIRGSSWFWGLLCCVEAELCALAMSLVPDTVAAPVFVLCLSLQINGWEGWRGKKQKVEHVECSQAFSPLWSFMLDCRFALRGSCNNMASMSLFPSFSLSKKHAFYYCTSSILWYVK